MTSIISSANNRRLGGLGLLAALLGGCAIATPFRGPAVVSGALVGLGPEDPVVVSVTEAQVDNGQRRAFGRQIDAVLAVLPSQPGYLGGSVRRELFGTGGWTMTLWRTEADVDAFYGSPAHRTAMREGMPTLISFRSVRFTLPAKSLPLSWDDAKLRLAAVPLSAGPVGRPPRP